MDDMLTASIEPLLMDCCTPTLVREVEQNPECQAGKALWRQVEESGFIDALVPESADGAGLSLEEAAGVLFAFGRHAMPLPIAHTMIARRLLADAGVAAPSGPIALAVLDEASSRLVSVPFGKVAEYVLVEKADGMWLVDMNDTTSSPITINRSLDLRLTITQGAGQRVAGSSAPEWESSIVLTLGAIVSAATMAGAMAKIIDITIEQVNDRQQFGRSIGKFQAVQHNLSVMAEHACAAQLAARLGCAGAFTDDQRMRAAVAKSRASRAAPLIANTAHALTGAMGITAEYDLQLYTRSLHAQRMQFGGEAFWNTVIGTHALSNWSSVVEGVVGLSA